MVCVREKAGMGETQKRVGMMLVLLNRCVCNCVASEGIDEEQKHSSICQHVQTQNDGHMSDRGQEKQMNSSQCAIQPSNPRHSSP